jgi:hypothetical protein
MNEMSATLPTTAEREAGRVIVTVTPYDDIAVMIISSVFEGKNQDERDALVWPALNDALDLGELGLLTRWELLTVDEARLVYPSLLKRRRSEVAVA